MATIPVSALGYVLRPKNLTQPSSLYRDGLPNRNPNPLWSDVCLTKKFFWLTGVAENFPTI